MHPTVGNGNPFKLLGCLFDPFLYMDCAIDATVKKIRPKLKSLLRTRAFYSIPDMVLQYKAPILSLLECHTGAIYHAEDKHLRRLDALQNMFLRAMGLDDKRAFLEFNIAPLGLRRDIAILGFLHKCNLGLSHPCIASFFRAGRIPAPHPAGSTLPRRHGSPLESHYYRAQVFLPLYERSILNMVHVYNLLPQAFIDMRTIKGFQSKLTAICRHKCLTEGSNASWDHWLCARRYNINNLANNARFMLR